MRVFIANFGLENYLWPTCRERSTVATVEDEDMRPFWLAGDRDGYIDRCIKTKKTANGITPPRQVASRWFNLAGIISTTENDLWIHREKDTLWWTISRPGEVQVTLQPAFKSAQPGDNVYVLQKPAGTWSNKNKRGAPLDWRGLHPKAREFLFTEGTLQKLAADNAAYAAALLEGDDLAPWHSRPAWKSKAASTGRGAVTTPDAKQRAIVRMATTTEQTVRGSNGQQVLRTVKNKELRFKPYELQPYIAALLDAQEGLCAVTNLRLQFDGTHDDEACPCSLDRIDSDGHYEPGNLQIVCRFVNRWKGDSNDTEFRRLIRLVRGEGDADQEHEVPEARVTEIS